MDLKTIQEHFYAMDTLKTLNLSIHNEIQWKHVHMQTNEYATHLPTHMSKILNRYCDLLPKNIYNHTTHITIVKLIDTLFGSSGNYIVLISDEFVEYYHMVKRYCKRVPFMISVILRPKLLL